MKYIPLTEGFTQPGDEWVNKGYNDWTPCRPGHDIADTQTRGFIFRRPVPDHNWRSLKTDPPKDGGTTGKILVLYPKGYRQSQDAVQLKAWNPERNGYLYADYWMPFDFVPEKPQPIKVDGREVVPQANGDVKLDCGTVIPAKDVEEFLRQRKEVMAS